MQPVASVLVSKLNRSVSYSTDIFHKVTRPALACEILSKELEGNFSSGRDMEENE